MSFGLNSIG